MSLHKRPTVTPALLAVNRGNAQNSSVGAALDAGAPGRARNKPGMCREINRYVPHPSIPSRIQAEIQDQRKVHVVEVLGEAGVHCARWPYRRGQRSPPGV